MQRRKFLTGSVTIGAAGLAGCMGDSEEEKECLPEDEMDFFSMSGDEVAFWAPEGDGFSLEVPRKPQRPDIERREDRGEEEPTFWLDITYEDQEENAYMIEIDRYQTEEFASEAGNSAETGTIAFPRKALIDGEVVISGSRGVYSYQVLAEEGQEEQARELFLRIPCIEEDHIQDTTS